MVEQRDFSAEFDRVTKKWSVTWKWLHGKEPLALKNGTVEYKVPEHARPDYEAELERWVSNDWLRPYDEKKLGPVRGLIPLLAVVQANKGKTRPVMDFRELNSYVEAYTAEADVCSDKLRQWRRQGVNTYLMDLSTAYMQLGVDASLWPFQTIMFRGERYCLTRLGFGLNVAPLVMKHVLKYVLSQDETVKRGTSAFVDDIYVNEDVVSVQRVREHLLSFGLTCKAEERVAEGTRVLGLRVATSDHGATLQWSRANTVPEVPEVLTRRSVFSFCGRMVGHLPVGGWLRPATAFVKRCANQQSKGWDDEITDSTLRHMLDEMHRRVVGRDPARGQWNVNGTEATLWVDASSVAMGAALEMSGQIVEDACWLRPTDGSHINMAELDSLVKGMNVALAWDIQKLHLRTDSLTVYHWISDTLSGRARVKTKAANEMLIRRRLGIFKSLVEEYDLDVDISLVPSAANLADCLTRVPQQWLRNEANRNSPCATAAVAGSLEPSISEIHMKTGHQGVMRTMYFVLKKNLHVTRGDVEKVVSECDVCQSIDPAPVRWKSGELSVERVWERLAMDITHYRGHHYLTLIDCGPSRFAVWKELRHQGSDEVCRVLETVFFERSAPTEILTDNDTAFRGARFQNFAERWGIRIRYRCAYVPSGNAIAERSHRQVKRTAARTGCSIAEAVYWHNVSPKEAGEEGTAPANCLYRYESRVLGIDGVEPFEDVAVPCRFREGDAVWVRPEGARCTTRYGLGTVTQVLSDQAVEVDGMPRHVKDLRPATEGPNARGQQDTPDAEALWPLVEFFPEGLEDSSDDTASEIETAPRRSARVRTSPARFGVEPYGHELD